MNNQRNNNENTTTITTNNMQLLWELKLNKHYEHHPDMVTLRSSWDFTLHTDRAIKFNRAGIVFVVFDRPQKRNGLS